MCVLRVRVACACCVCSSSQDICNVVLLLSICLVKIFFPPYTALYFLVLLAHQDVAKNRQSKDAIGAMLKLNERFVDDYGRCWGQALKKQKKKKR